MNNSVVEIITAVSTPDYQTFGSCHIDQSILMNYCYAHNSHFIQISGILFIINLLLLYLYAFGGEKISRYVFANLINILALNALITGFMYYIATL